MQRVSASLAGDQPHMEMEAEDNSSGTELGPITGRVKWFDATRGLAAIHFRVFSCVTTSTDAGK